MENIQTKIRWFLLAVIIGIAVFFSTYKLTESPPFWYDEGWYVQTAENLAQVGVDGIQLSPTDIRHLPILTVGYPLIYPLSGWFELFGIGVLSARSLMVLFILLFLGSSYALAKRLFGPWSAIGSVALLATFAPLYGNGKSVLGEVPGMFYLLSSLVFFNLAKVSSGRKRLSWLIISGISAGLCAATKPVFLLVAIALLAGALVEKSRNSLSLKEVWIGIAAFIVPVVAWVFIQFPGGVSLSEMLAFYANPYADASLTQSALDNLSRIIADPSILYTLAVMAVWVVSIAWRRYSREKIAGEEVIALAFSLLVIAAFLRVGSVFRYIFPAQVLGLIFLPSSLAYISNRLSARFWHGRPTGYAVIAIIALLSSYGVHQLSFDSWVAESYASEKTAFWEAYFGSEQGSSSYFFYDVPEVVPFIRHRDYYQFLLAPAGDPTGRDQLEALRSAQAERVIIATSKYEAAADTGLFDRYSIESTAYKYSILSRD